MSFLTDDDYDVQARAAILAVLETGSLSRANAESMAQEEITSYLRPRGYDVAAVFSASGDSRNPLIIMYMIDMALYHLHSSLAGRAIPKNREDRYRAALEWLTQVNHDKLDPTLPKLPDPNTDPSWRFGNNGQYSVAW